MSLLKKLFGLDRVTPHDPKTSAYLTTVYGNEQLASIECLLRSEELLYRTCDRGAGGVVRAIAGFTMYGTDVFVSPEDLERAQSLLAQAEANAEPTAEDGATDSEDQESLD